MAVSSDDSGMSCDDSDGPVAPQTDDDAPLDFSMKPAAPSRHRSTGGSAFETVRSRDRQPEPPASGSLSSMLGQKSPHGSLQPYLNPLLASLLPPLNHGALLPAFLNAQRGPAPGAKATVNPQRPFKAYNPADPLSALQVSATAAANNKFLLPNTAPDDLLTHYRQCLANAQDAFNKHKMGTRDSPAVSTTPSPPEQQVTSTSHPHRDSASPLVHLPRCSTAAGAHPVLVESASTPADVAVKATTAAKGDGYWERRRKNNEAAKRSRDTRRLKEDEIAMRAALLEQENLRLRLEVAQLKAETEKLRQLLLNM